MRLSYAEVALITTSVALLVCDSQGVTCLDQEVVVQTAVLKIMYER